MNDAVKEFRQVYFIGIGGIGMSALARFFKSVGAAVSGYDKTPSDLTEALVNEGIAVHFEDNPGIIPENPDLVVYTPAVPADHAELKFYLQKKSRVLKRSEVLEIVTKSSLNICIAGTHGKTTITTMIAHILRDSGYGCTAFLGGISVNYNTNFWSSNDKVCVIEADEYDRSFLKLSPDVAVITAMDADHLDIYGTAQAMEQAFIEFAGKIKPTGRLIRQFGLKRGKEFTVPAQWTYSLQNDQADVYAHNIRMVNGTYEFDIQLAGKEIEGFRLEMGGMHNVENAVAAIAVSSSLKIEGEKIKNAISNFRGVKRRFEYIIRNERLVFIDDYAHHPEELKALIQGAKSLFRQKKCTVIFQPHLFSRTRDLADGFAEVLDLADEVILLPIYPAREKPIAGVDSELILSKMKKERKKVVSKEGIEKWIANEYKPSMNKEFGAVLITAGAGDIDTEIESIKNILKDI